MLKPSAVLLGLASVLEAQSISISSLTPGQVVSGVPLNLRVEFRGLVSLYSVEYLLNQQRLALVKAPYSYVWSPTEVWSGSHKMQAIARDVMGNILASSPETAFIVANGADTIAVAPSALESSAWSGTISFAASITRSDGVDSYCYLYVDGVPYSSSTSSSTSCTLFLDTTGFENGPHRIFVQASNIYTTAARGMWARTVTFANDPTTQVGLRAGFQELFLTPGETATLTPTLVLADSSTVPSTSSLPVSDSFNRADESPMAGAWTVSEGAIVLSGNAITGKSAEANAGFFWNRDTFPADQYAELKVTAFGAGTFVGPAVRMLKGGTYYGCESDGTMLYLSRRVNGVTINPGVKSKATSVGDVIRIEVSGRSPVSLVCKVNGVTELTYADAGADRILYGQAGVGAYRDTGATRGDDWAAGALNWRQNPPAVYLTSDPAIATVDDSGQVTAVSTGDCDITVFSRGRSVNVRASVNASSTLPHFGVDGALLNSYDPAKSMIMRSWFFAGRNQLSAYPNAIQDYRIGGANTWEEGMYFSPADGETQTAWTTRIDGHYSALSNFANTSGLKMLGTGDGMARLNIDLYKSTRGVWRDWTPDPVAYAFTKARDSGFVIGVEMVDEVNYAHGNTPFPHGLVKSTGPFTQIGCTTTTPPNSVCTVHWTKFSRNGSNRFIISGATSDLSLNSVSGSVYPVASVLDTNRFTFNATNVGTRTFNASSDPALQIEMLASQWVGTDYVRLSAFSTLMSAINSVPNRPRITWPVAAASDQYTRQNWLGNSQVSDYTTIFWAASTRRTPWGQTVPELIGDMRTNYRDFYAVVQRDKPWTMITPAAGPMYKIGGVLKRVATISGGLVVFSQPHEVSTLIPGTTRIRVAGNSGVNGDFYVTAIPTANTMSLAYKNPVHTGTGFGGMATFETGHVFNVVSLGVPTAGDPILAVTDPGGCPLPTLLHRKFTVSGTSVPGLNREWYFAKPSSGSICTLTGLVREVPDVTGNGGSAYVISTNTYVPGRNQLIVPGLSLPAVVAGYFYPILQGAAGVRVYGLSNVDPEQDEAASSSFQNEPASGDGINYNSSPRYKANGMQARWSSLVAAMRVTRHLEKFLLQPRLHAPDYGSQLMCTVRQGAFGRLLACLNQTEGLVSRTIALSPYSHGTTITRYRVTNRGMMTSTANASDDTLTMEPAEVVIYVMPVNEDVPSEALILLRGDVPQATKTVVEWAYDPALLERQETPVVCTGPCTLPVDIRMGPIWYRYHYLDGLNRVIATSDVSDVMLIAKKR